ncbi:uncharacterized protein LOC122849453 [Aphidius gifuensis]|uniref:uncharacterized protein LOC122849453 n=1 Tax=Aphidius gifuensis TaxID=684658 RepID=UPI001CDD339F|nr:uncharacterized protein LOC122849453 [Aphidius gifuensis]
MLVYKDGHNIYYQHHDHSYAENIIIDHARSIKIDCVNDDCLAEIFMYVPAWERPKIAVVCQKWNRVLDYSWGRVKKLQLTHWERAEYPNCLKKFTTPDGKLSFLNSLLNKCGRYLTQLDLTAYGHSDIVSVINEYCPNLVELRLRFTYDNHRLYWKSFSRLSKLKVLTVIFQNHLKHHAKLNELVHALESLADTLTDLTLFNWETDEPCTDRFLPYLPCRFPADTIYVS